MDPPSETEVDELAGQLGIVLTEEERRDMAAILAATLEDVSRVAELPEPDPPRGPSEVPGDRTSYRPDDDEDAHGAWLRKCRVEGAARGPLSGSTVGLKDTISLAGVEQTIGADLMAGYVPSSDATVVTRLLDAGATILGKNNLIGIGPGYEPPTNPTAPEYSIGGSTSGGAAAVAAGDVDVAIGGDQQGSIRIPASYAGLVGLKPTHGLVPYTGIFGHAASLDYTGPIARTVETVARTTGVIAGRDGLDSRQPPDLEVAPYEEVLGGDVTGMSVGVLREGFDREAADEPVVDLVSEAAEEFETTGAAVEGVSVPLFADSLPISFLGNMVGMAETFDRNGATAGFDGWHDTERIAFTGDAMREGAGDLATSSKARWLTTAYLKRRGEFAVAAKAWNLVHLLRRALDEALSEFDALVLPTSPMLPPRAGTGAGDLTERGVMIPSAVNTGLFNLTHHPAMTVPCGRVDGAPIGMMLVGSRFDEAALFRLAHAYERRTDHGVAA